MNSFRIDLEEVLHSLQIRNICRIGDEVSFSCPFPEHSHNDEKPSSSINLHSLQWNCFACHRHGTLITFISEHEGVSPIVARRWLRERFGGTFREPQGSFEEELFPSRPNLTTPEQPNPPLSETLIEEFETDWLADTHHATYMAERGFDPQTLNTYQLGWDRWSQRVTLPVRNDFGHLVGFKGRSVDPQARAKYMVLGDSERLQHYGFKPYRTANVVWGIDSIKSNNIILCEGELNALKLRQYGFSDSVGISGSSVSSQQILLLRRFAHNVTMIFDCDLPGVRGMSRAVEGLEGYVHTFITPEHAKDPCEMTQIDVFRLLSRRVSTITNMLKGL